MAYTYQFDDHLREHRSSRLGQRLWWLAAAAGIGAGIADAVYLAATPRGELSAALAYALPFGGALLLLAAWAALSVADWTYPAEQRYRAAQDAAARQARAYILAGRRTRHERPPGEFSDPAG